MAGQNSDNGACYLKCRDTEIGKSVEEREQC